ncbi:hypothetical protein MMC30_008155 [Trapelia coarctata]|nr:hypothetical protein [Trapelia coarctata]
MSLKQEIETWVEALAQYDSNEFEESLKTFDGISDTSKILFNCGVIHATLGEHNKAVECYQRAVRLDQYLAVAYFQQGVSNFLVGDFEEALANFNDTLLYLRGNTYIDYEQLGLKFKLFSCEVLFNRGLCYIYLQQKGAGMGDLMYAAKEKVTPDHDVIDEAIKEDAEGYTVFSIPVGVVYRPNSAKVKNLKTKDYLGKARLIASVNPTNTTTGFAGPEIKRSESQRGEPRPLDSVSFAASNLVRSDIASRARQQSEPPIHRNMFPPTPPPENEPLRPTMPPSARTSPPSNPPPTLSNPVPAPLNTRANSVRNGPMRQPSNPSTRPPGMERRISEDQISPKSHTKSSSIPNLNAALPPILPQNANPAQNQNPNLNAYPNPMPNLNPYQIGNPFTSPPPKPLFPPLSTSFNKASYSDSPTALSATQPSLPNLYASGYPVPPNGSISRASPDRPRLGTARTASEPRGPTSKYSSRTDRGPQGQGSRGRLFMETIPAHASEGELPDDEYPDELYDLYRNTAYSNPYSTTASISSASGGGAGSAPRRPSSKTRSGEAREARTNRSRERSQPRGVGSADEEGGVSPSGTTHSSLDDFEILNDAGGTLSRPRGESRVRNSSRPRNPSRSRHPLSGSSAQGGFAGSLGAKGSVSSQHSSSLSHSHPHSHSHSHPHPAERKDDIRTLRIKLHHHDDTRYLMIPSTIAFPEFLAKVSEKLGLRGAFKPRIRDEGDLITMGDRDDWEMAVAGARKAAREGGGEMGRLDVWVVEVGM